MNQSDSNPERNERLRSLFREQDRVRRIRLRRRNAGAVTMMVLILGGVIWMTVPSNHPVTVSPNQHASSSKQQQASPAESTGAVESVFRVVRVEDQPLQIVTIVQRAQPQRVEIISDVQLFLAMREQGIDAGFMRIDGQTRLAFKDEQSRRRFEESIDSPK